ncbi:MAG TPA: MFS transporter [Pseudonocardia sp.]|jgi:DHA1 family inner membrane transport protein
MPLALLALALGGFGIGTTEFVIMGLLPQVAADLRIDIPTAGHLISAYALGVVVGAPLLTAFTVRLPRQRVLIGLMGLFAAGNLLSALAPSYGWLVAARFLAGLPHGAFFGAGAIVAASLVEASRSARAVSMMFLGLTVANMVGVPAGTLLGDSAGWRWTFALVAVIAAVAAVAVATLVPRGAAVTEAPESLRGQLAALRRPQVLLTLAVVVFGFGGLFACYSYVAPMMTEVAGFPASAMTPILVVVGAGMTVGSLLGGFCADRAPLATLLVGLGALTVVLAALSVALATPWVAVPLLFLVGFCSLGLGPAVQTRIVAQAGDAPSLVSAGFQSAANIANSVGAWLGGLAIAAGWGLAASNLVGAGLAGVGVLLLVGSGLLEVRQRRARVAAPAPEPAEARAAA